MELLLLQKGLFWMKVLLTGECLVVENLVTASGKANNILVLMWK